MAPCHVLGWSCTDSGFVGGLVRAWDVGVEVVVVAVRLLTLLAWSLCCLAGRCLAKLLLLVWVPHYRAICHFCQNPTIPQVDIVQI